MFRYRIELGEIEAALAEHSQVAQAVVVLREDRPDDKRLVAYWVPTEAAPEVTQLRRHLLKRLPGYMLPESISRLLPRCTPWPQPTSRIIDAQVQVIATNDTQSLPAASATSAGASSGSTACSVGRPAARKTPVMI